MTSVKITGLLHDGKHYKRLKGQIISTFDDKNMLYLLESGYVKRYMISREGSLGVQSVYGPKSFFPLTPVFATLLQQKIYHGTEVYCYEAMTDVTYYCIENSVLATAAEADPWIYKELLFEAGERLQSNIQRLESVSLKSAAKRVAHYLVCLAQRLGETNGTGVKIPVPLTQQDIADNLNMTRETVSRALTGLQKQGLLTIGRNMFIPNIKLLQKVYS